MPFAGAGESTGAFFSLGATCQPSENDSPASLLRDAQASFTHRRNWAFVASVASSYISQSV